MLGLTPIERQRLLLSVGTHKGRRPLTPVEVAALVDKAMKAGMSAEQVAESLHFEGTTMVGRFLKLLSLAPQVRHLVDFGTGADVLGFTQAFEITRLKKTDDQVALASGALRHRLSSSEVRQITQMVLRSTRPIDDCIREVVGMRPEIEVRHIVVGAIADHGSSSWLASVTQAERDACLREILEPEAAVLSLISAKLGVERFTLVGGEALGKADSGELEAMINSRLAARSAK